MATRLAFDFYGIYSEFDRTVQMMDCQDYDLNEIVSNWQLNQSESEIASYYENYLLKSNEESDTTDSINVMDDAKYLCRAVIQLYRRMDRLAGDINKRYVRRAFLDKSMEQLFIEI